MAGHLDQAVAVGIRLDDAHHWHANVGSDGPQVVADRVEVDDDPAGALAGDFAHAAIRPYPARQIGPGSCPSMASEPA